MQITMAHHAEFLAQVIVEAESDAQTGMSRQALGRKELERGGGQTLAALVSSIAGVTTLQNGSGIAKPVIHGLTGNRIAILNNGLLQAGQQWGNDHAPEIDPFTADRLRVIKGVETIAYGGNTLGGAVLVEPSHIPDDPHLHGPRNMFWQQWPRTYRLCPVRTKSPLKATGGSRVPSSTVATTALLITGCATRGYASATPPSNSKNK
ncbi:MAG: Plug domain-containing protein [Saprospiraceae bacterium]